MARFLRVKRKSLDLNLTLYPSFTLALLEPKGGRYVKAVGWRRGCYVEARGDYVISNCGKEELRYWSGLWFIEELERIEVKRSVRWLIDILREHYGGLGLSVNPFDPLHMFIPVFLSQNTDYHTNVLRWCRSLWRLTDDPLEAARRGPEVGSSYQLSRLSEALACAAAALTGGLWNVRKKLVSCKWVGPKVADAFLLFALCATDTAPIDKHFLRMASRLGLWERAKPPSKTYCAHYACYECPRRHQCARWLASNSLGRAAGWVQTVFYVHDKLYCSRRVCSECPLKAFCEDQLRDS